MTITIQESTENASLSCDKLFYDLYKANKDMASIDETKISCSALRRFIQDTRSNMENFDQKEPKYFTRWLKEQDKDVCNE